MLRFLFVFFQDYEMISDVKTAVKPRQGCFVRGCAAIVIAVVISVVVVMCLVGYGLYSGDLASTQALPQHRLPRKQLTEIEQIISLRPNESVLYFYSDAITVSGDGNLFTNQRVISYTNDSDVLELSDATYDEISDLAYSQGSFFDPSIITVFLKNDYAFDLWIGTDSGGDRRFYDRLIQEWKEKE